MLEERKSVRRNKEQTGAVRDWPQPLILHPPVLTGEVVVEKGRGAKSEAGHE